MTNLISYISIIVLGGFLLGLTFYSFYLVLTSKDRNVPSESASPQKIDKKKKPVQKF